MKPSESLEGEIIFREKYGSTSQERLYIKPPEQGNVVVLNDERYSDIVGFFSKIFLPQGYPNSVSKDYISYQMWDTAQAFCSTITGTLATQEVLRGVGVGDTTSTPLAATVTWVIKDGCGHIGRILFAYSHGTYLDAYSKKWRLYADTLNDAAMCIEISLPFFKKYTTIVLCVSTVMKAIVGVAGGATRAAMTQHQAVRGNLADVSAKDSAQETAVNLIASFTALFIISTIGNSLFLFSIMVILHIVFNYFAVRAICLRTLNEPRFLQVITKYLRQEIISTPCEINRTEPIIFYQFGQNILDLHTCGFQIKLGYSLQKLAKRNLKASFLKKLLEIYSNRNYILIPNINDREMYVVIREGAETDNILSAYFHAVLLSMVISAINDQPLAVISNNVDPRPFTQVCQTLQSAEWSREPYPESTRSGYHYMPSEDLLIYIDNIAEKEWCRFNPGLEKTGWDLSKHLLMVDEWRCANEPAKQMMTPKMSLLDLSRTKKNVSYAALLQSPDSLTSTTYMIEPERTVEPKVPVSDAPTKTQETEDVDKSTTTSETDVKIESNTKLKNIESNTKVKKSDSKFSLKPKED